MGLFWPLIDDLMGSLWLELSTFDIDTTVNLWTGHAGMKGRAVFRIGLTRWIRVDLEVPGRFPGLRTTALARKN